MGKKPMPGVVEIALGVSAIAEASGGNYFKNGTTDRIRSVIPGVNQLPRGLPRAVAMVLVGGIVHKEANKAKVNPKVPLLPMRWI